MSSIIHIFSKPSSYYRNFDMGLISQDDKVLLQQDACYDQSKFVVNCPAPLFMLETCALARGISPIESITLIDDLSWVDLIASSDKSITW
ncbi:DsrH/TusB family sulfur metabolism protein [Pseudoalteromonas luteoviolacea]|uniref:Uncharacterized protein n=1 Tax=Pseudoalteromonas luteoviolacea S4054 TaxID=1129367 RepID=A0A0F6ABI8_9GAMM|nr:DsrH/TusB family sulfur metabolism protein [Pseudoalteromonas luteoviolacea]AOT08469.1 hypothetical protein S4054249_11715 [Pseudoalteromonas luteoviolacea]AOT13385.1 hypothetical protein S40542_11690 [Pseudoalteromonas luteoviolacea]AOT18298.1 hypothetical protein S4054_11690 [Pseudoalteromonas luteoviolacea]KKE83535.1 hypothetical protein N479_14280 [Pseudoalteromonas luteoviolacea S4054]KZN75972.1 hypothetical protein N481_06375 [Pseudoalteromonas luteoviolacea S4047-1]